MSISIGLLKLGASLVIQSVDCNVCSLASADLLVLVVLLAVVFLALCRNIDPKTALSADGARALDLKPDLVMRLGDWWKVDVITRDVWRAVISQRKQVDVLGMLLHWSHDDRSDDRRNECEKADTRERCAKFDALDPVTEMWIQYLDMPRR